MKIRHATDLDVAGKRVLLRLDLNLPLEDGKIADDTRLLASLETIRDLKDRGARLVLASHLGRPNGQKVPKLSMEPVAARLAEVLEGEVYFTHEPIGDDVEFLTAGMPR